MVCSRRVFLLILSTPPGSHGADFHLNSWPYFRARICDSVHTSSAKSSHIIKLLHFGRTTEMDAQPGSQSNPPRISDRLFIQQLGYTRSLVTFLIRRQALPGTSPDVLANLAALGSMRYSPAGRAASEEEWQKLYAISHGLASKLPLEIATAFSIWRLRVVCVKFSKLVM
jgi:hypothetical protein